MPLTASTTDNSLWKTGAQTVLMRGFEDFQRVTTSNRVNEKRKLIKLSFRTELVTRGYSWPVPLLTS